MKAGHLPLLFLLASVASPSMALHESRWQFLSRVVPIAKTYSVDTVLRVLEDDRTVRHSIRGSTVRVHLRPEGALIPTCALAVLQGAASLPDLLAVAPWLALGVGGVLGAYHAANLATSDVYFRPRNCTLEPLHVLDVSIPVYGPEGGWLIDVGDMACVLKSAVVQGRLRHWSGSKFGVEALEISVDRFFQVQKVEAKGVLVGWAPEEQLAEESVVVFERIR